MQIVSSPRYPVTCTVLVAPRNAESPAKRTRYWPVVAAGFVIGGGQIYREALANVLDNACRHAKGRVDIAVSGVPGSVRVSVVDDGGGLPDGEAERAFDRFVSLDGAGGAGLGLPIARSLLRTQGGDLSYEDGCFVLRIKAFQPR